MQLPSLIGEHAIRLSPTSPNGKVERNRIACRTGSTSRISPSMRKRRHRVQAKIRWPTVAGPSGSTRSTVISQKPPYAAGCISRSQTTSAEACTSSAGHTFTAMPFPPLQSSPLLFRKFTAGPTPTPRCMRSTRSRGKAIDECTHRRKNLVRVGPKYEVARVRQQHDRGVRKPASKPTGELGRLLQPPSGDRRVDAETSRTFRRLEDREHRAVDVPVTLAAVIDRAGNTGRRRRHQWIAERRRKEPQGVLHLRQR